MPNLRPLTPAESEKISAKGFDPGEYVADDSGRAINRAAIASMDAAGLQQSFGLSPRDAGVYSQRGPITSALTEGLNRMGAGLFGAGERLTGIDKLGDLRREAQNVAEIMASKRQPGGLDTALGIGAGLATQLPLYVSSFPAAMAINALSSGAEGAQLTEEAGGSGGAQALNALIRGGSSALTDAAGAKFAVPAAKAIMQSAKPAMQRAGAMLVPAAFGAAENATAQFGANVADKVTFNPNKGLMEGTGTSALVGAAIPVAVGARQAFGGGSSAPTISPRAEVERINRMSYDDKVAAIPELNKRLREAGKPEMTLDQFGGPAGNRLSPQAIEQFFDLALTTGEGSAMGSPNEQLAARAIKSGIIRRDSPTAYNDVRAVFNIGETALRDIQPRALNEGVAGEQLDVANTLTSLANQTKIEQAIDKRQAEVDTAMAAAEASRRAEFEKQGQARQAASDKAAAEAALAKQAELDAAAEREETARFEAKAGTDAEAALRAEYSLPAEFMFSAVDTKGKIAEAKKYGKARSEYDKARSAGLREGFEGKTPYDPASPLGQLQQKSLSSVTPGPRPMSAAETMLAQREQGEVDAMKAAADAQAKKDAAAAAAQTVTTTVPAPETMVTGAAALPNKPAAGPENKTTSGNAKTAVTTAPVVPKVGKDAAIKPNAPSQAPEGSPKEAGKSAPAATSVALPGKSPTSSALSMPTSTPNPSAASVVEAGGAQAATPVQAPKLPINDQIKQSYQRAVDKGDTKTAKELATLLRNRGVPIPDNAAEAPPPPPPITSALNTPEVSNLSPVARDIGAEANAVNLAALKLEMAGDTAGADKLRADFEAKRRAALAPTSAVTLPKAEVATPVATVKAEPAVKTDAMKRGNVNEDGTIWFSGQRVKPTAYIVNQILKEPDNVRLREKLNRSIPRLEQLAKEQPNASVKQVRRVGYDERLASLDADTTVGSFAEALREAKARLAKLNSYEADLREAAGVPAIRTEVPVVDKPEAKLGSPERMRAFDEKEKARLPDDILNQSREIDGLRSTIKDLEPYAKGLKVGDYDVAQYKERLKTRRAELKAAIDELKATQQRAKEYGLPHTVAAIEKAGAAPPPLKIKKQKTEPVTDPLAADKATLAAVDLEVRPGKRGNWELYDKSIDEVRRDLGSAADEAEAVSQAARIVREESGKGIGSKMRETRQDEAGFVINPAELIEAGGRAVATGVRSVLNRIRSATNQLGDHATRTGDETAAYGHRKLNETATVAAIDATKIINENQSFWNKLSSSERSELTDALQYERAWRKAWPGELSPKVKQAYLETRNLMRELGERAAKDGPRIQEGKEWRPLIVDEFWVPEALSMKVVKELQDTSIDKATGRPKRDIKLDEFREWARQNGLSDKQIDTEIKRFDIENKTADADLEFDALHRPMTIPLPPGWAGNTQDAINRYATKYAFEMARHKYIDQDKLLGPLSRGQRESLDDLGRLTQRPDEAGQVGDTTDALFRAALNSFALQINPGRQTVAQRLSGVANPLAVQTGATIRDTVNMFGTLVDDAGVKNSIKGVLDGVTKYRTLKQRGLIKDTGNLSGDVQRVGEAFENGQVLELFRDTVRAGNRLAGVDALNKFMQAVSSAAGIARAKEAIAKNDDAFFKKVGIPEWKAMDPSAVEDFVAKWVVEGSQGSMGAKDQPTHLLKSSGAGAQFFPIMRWAFSFSNQQIDRAWKPLMDKNLSAFDRVKPLATRLAGAAGATAAANLLLQTMFGRDDRNPTFKEWEAAGYPNKLKYLVQKLSDLQVLPAITAFANVVVGNQQMPRNLGVEIAPNLLQQFAALQEVKRDYSYEDYVTAVDALFDKVSSNWRDASKLAAGNTKDEIEQARARYEGMNTTLRPAVTANPLNLTTQFNKAKTVDEVKEIAQRIVSTAHIDTPNVSVKGPSEDAAFDKWLEKSNPELWKTYRKENMVAGLGLDAVYNSKKLIAEAVNKALEQKRMLLASKEPNDVKRAKVLKLNWEKGGEYELK